ncbi:uroporphyrinogen decarboxylase [Leadbettera azotonutricia]|uniref:Uroporphyrinogen decarboxylase (URO-D) superfamily n=1 Tax=Leadbettera azotonutricia (strain ATCC BAA-888 / DSM 13862 / ZAS-9) TaxID=545695 RepID=F5Y7Y5_LEAAZ|nr:uroporphyrinogen decarboxylase [Leadbettera azotonutricia]AEF80573.1 uroporphyrinogen decarboxylase (URO-D) superfamily [Leadbettera azotonutricia ZAS-9]
MNGYERIKTVLQGKKADKVPLMLHSFLPAAAESGFTMEEYRSNAGNMARSHINFARKYDLDGILLDVDTCVLAGAVGTILELPKDGPARAIAPASKNYDELLELMDPKRLYACDRIKIILEAVHIMRREIGGEIFIRGNCDQMAYSLAMLAYGMEDFLADLMDEDQSEKILALIDKAYYVHFEYNKMMMEAGADMTSFGDSSCGPDLISRDMFLKFSLPFHKRLKQDLERLNIATICHICGNLDIIVDDVASVGFTGVEVDYKTNLEKMAMSFKNKSTVFGPIDPSGMFYFGTPETMSAEVRKVLNCFHGEGIVLGAGCAIPKGAPEENIRTFTKTAREYMI